MSATINQKHFNDDHQYSKDRMFTDTLQPGYYCTLLWTHSYNLCLNRNNSFIIILTTNIIKSQIKPIQAVHKFISIQHFLGFTKARHCQHMHFGDQFCQYLNSKSGREVNGSILGIKYNICLPTYVGNLKN